MVFYPGKKDLEVSRAAAGSAANVR